LHDRDGGGKLLTFDVELIGEGAGAGFDWLRVEVGYARGARLCTTLPRSLRALIPEA
jgi:hypothetical protein